MKSNDNQNSSLIMLVGTKYAIWFSTTKSYKSLNLLTVTSCKVLKKQPFPLRLNSTFISLHMIHKVFSLNLRNVYAEKNYITRPRLGLEYSSRKKVNSTQRTQKQPPLYDFLLSGVFKVYNTACKNENRNHCKNCHIA